MFIYIPVDNTVITVITSFQTVNSASGVLKYIVHQNRSERRLSHVLQCCPRSSHLCHQIFDTEAGG